ncbi:MAG: hypothetical protein JSW09_04830 [Pseudomonadota bacterium]|nr:MAG: hypothetical protein JSW09_04830 [Pseudomonadota bacterium]
MGQFSAVAEQGQSTSRCRRGNCSGGREIANVHDRRDGDLGIRIDEELAISVFRELANPYNASIAGDGLSHCDGAPVTITETP